MESWLKIIHSVKGECYIDVLTDIFNKDIGVLRLLNTVIDLFNRENLDTKIPVIDYSNKDSSFEAFFDALISSKELRDKFFNYVYSLGDNIIQGSNFIVAINEIEYGIAYLEEKWAELNVDTIANSVRNLILDIFEKSNSPHYFWDMMESFGDNVFLDNGKLNFSYLYSLINVLDFQGLLRFSTILKNYHIGSKDRYKLQVNIGEKYMNKYRDNFEDDFKSRSLKEYILSWSDWVLKKAFELGFIDKSDFSGELDFNFCIENKCFSFINYLFVHNIITEDDVDIQTLLRLWADIPLTTAIGKWIISFEKFSSIPLSEYIRNNCSGSLFAAVIKDFTSYKEIKKVDFCTYGLLYYFNKKDDKFVADAIRNDYITKKEFLSIDLFDYIKASFDLSIYEAIKKWWITSELFNLFSYEQYLSNSCYKTLRLAYDEWFCVPPNVYVLRSIWKTHI